MPGAPGLFRISWKIAGTRPCLRNWRGRVRRASAMRGSRLLAKIHMRRYCTAFGATVIVNLNRWCDLEGLRPSRQIRSYPPSNGPVPKPPPVSAANLELSPTQRCRFGVTRGRDSPSAARLELPSPACPPSAANLELCIASAAYMELRPPTEANNSIYASLAALNFKSATVNRM